MTDIQEAIVKTAPAVVTSCIGAHQLLAGSTEDGGSRNFPLVVLDEAAQTTEPALVCALSAARAEQLIYSLVTQNSSHRLLQPWTFVERWGYLLWQD